MKRLLLLIGSFLSVSFHLFGIEENRLIPVYPLDFCDKECCENIAPALLPAASPAIIPDIPRVLGEQTGSDHPGKAKASFGDARIFFSLWFSWVIRPGYITSASPKEPLFILFRNLRI